MKISRLASTNRTPPPESAEGTARPEENRHLQVSSTKDTEADRRRSRRQEMEEIQPKAIGPFEGQDQILESAREVAEKLASLGPGAAELVRTDHPLPDWRAVDAKA